MTKATPSCSLSAQRMEGGVMFRYDPPDAWARAFKVQGRTFTLEPGQSVFVSGNLPDGIAVHYYVGNVEVYHLRDLLACSVDVEPTTTTTTSAPAPTSTTSTTVGTTTTLATIPSTSSTTALPPTTTTTGATTTTRPAATTTAPPTSTTALPPGIDATTTTGPAPAVPLDVATSSTVLAPTSTMTAVAEVPPLEHRELAMTGYDPFQVAGAGLLVIVAGMALWGSTRDRVRGWFRRGGDIA